MGAELEVTSRPAADGGVELTAIGELDLSTIERFESALHEACDRGAPDRKPTLDLRGVQYLDSAAINVLFNHADRIGLIRVHPLLMRGLTISGLDQIVEVRSAPAD